MFNSGNGAAAIQQGTKKGNIRISILFGYFFAIKSIPKNTEIRKMFPAEEKKAIWQGTQTTSHNFAFLVSVFTY